MYEYVSRRGFVAATETATGMREKREGQKERGRDREVEKEKTGRERVAQLQLLLGTIVLAHLHYPSSAEAGEGPQGHFDGTAR